MSTKQFAHLGRFVLLLLAFPILAAAQPELVDIRAIDPTIVVELRYAGSRNAARRPLYPAQMPALVRPSVAARLVAAQSYLQIRGYGLKIWDAYRPKAAHDLLWQISRNSDYIEDPANGTGSLHTWGVAVDATLVDHRGRDVAMPTDFDDFTPAAMLRYNGNNAQVRYHLRILQSAMARAGFYGLRTEWWHFIAPDWRKYRAVSDPRISSLR